MPTPREILIDDQGRVMQRAEGDLATPDCPECCGDKSCASAALCTTTPGYADIHPKTIWFDCPADRRICHNPDTPRLIEFGGYCYQPNYDEDGLLVCEPCPGSTLDDQYIGDPTGQITCLAPDVTCDDSPCADPMGNPDCCEDGFLLCPNPDCGCTAATHCDCGKRYAFAWSGTLVIETYKEFTGELCSRETRTAECLAIVDNYCPEPGPCGWANCVRRYGGVRKLVECFNSCFGCVPGDTFTPYGPPLWPTPWGPACYQVWTEISKAFPELGSPLTECDRTTNQACNSSQQGRHLVQTGTIHCDQIALDQSLEVRYKASCGLASKTTISVVGQVSRLIECEALADARRPGAMELL